MRWIKRLSLLVALIMGLIIFQPRFLPFLTSEKVLSFAQEFDPLLSVDGAAVDSTNLGACKSVEDMRVPSMVYLTMAFASMDERFQRSLDLIALKFARCHITHSDGIGYPFYSSPLYYFHPFVQSYSRQIKELGQECGEELRSSCSLHRVAKYESLLEDELIEAEVVAICSSLSERNIDNYGEVCRLLEI